MASSKGSLRNLISAVNNFGAENVLGPKRVGAEFYLDFGPESFVAETHAVRPWTYLRTEIDRIRPNGGILVPKTIKIKV